jgi:hypothetical protein
MVSGFRAQPKSPSFEPLERRLLLSVTTEQPPGLGPEPLADDPLPKWEQYPATAEPGNVFLGWNQLSWHEGQQIAADDWFCDSDDALTGVVWWGSYIGWDDLGEPPVRPDLFHLAVWTDVPAGFDQPFSHPGRVIWEADAYGVDSEFVGWDYDPRTGTYEACYRYQHELPQSEWFEQPGDQGIYWLSIAAGYLMTPEVEYPWGWKTRPRDPDTGAPDAAVEIFSPTGAHVDDLYRMGQPIGEPGVQPWDLAFELLTGSGEIDKWGQPPDPERGMNVLAGPRAPGPTAPYEKFLADDFRCEQSGPVTEIVIWASYLQDVRIDEPLRFNLAFYEDLPASQSPTGYSMPEGPIWNRYLEPVKEEMVGHFEEPFFDPNLNEIVGADWTLWKYTFAIDPADAFYQEAGNIYWLGVHHSFDLNGDGTVDLGDSQLLSQHGWAFGWKSAEGVWNDGAVWTDVSSMGTGGEIQPPEGSWNQLLRPQMEEPFDLAFALRTKGPAPGGVHPGQRLPRLG